MSNSLLKSIRAWHTLVGIVLTSSTQAQTPIIPPSSLRQLDSVYAVHGIRFGTPEGVSGVQPQFSGVGKRWKTTHMYVLIADTTTLARQNVHPEFWFRGGRFIGATYQLKNEQKSRAVLQELTRHYGPSRSGNVKGAQYWLGQRTYILYEDIFREVALHIASLDMLNEQVIETSVRQEARATLGWKPDSLGLPRQFPLPTEKQKK